MSSTSTFDRFDKAWIIPFAIFTILYWLFFGFIVGIDGGTVLFYVATLGLYFGSQKSRYLAIGFTPFFIYLICYSSLKVLHDFNGFPIHLEDLYLLEKQLFGINVDGTRMILCEYFDLNQTLLGDLISGIFYITWAPFPIIFGLILYFAGRRKLLFDFWMCFLIANIFGFIGYIFYPAAPPWYYMEFGNQLIIDTPSSAAGLLRFDELVGIPIYSSLYSGGTNTFGAMPSMHAAFPMILLYYSIKYGNKALIVIFIISMFAIWFGAVYSGHHYILDLLAGFVCGILGIIIAESIVNRKFAVPWYQKIVDYIA